MYLLEIKNTYNNKNKNKDVACMNFFNL